MTNEAKKREPERKTETWTCVGQRFQNGKLMQGWVRGVDNLRERQKEAMFWGGKGLCFACAGMSFRVVYQEEQPGQVTAFTRGEHAPEFLAMVEDEEVTAEWDALSHAATTRAAAGAASKKVTPGMYQALDPIRRAMGKSNMQGRRAIVASVLEYLTRTAALEDES